MLPIDEINQIFNTVRSNPELHDLLASAVTEIVEAHLGSEYDKSYGRWIDSPPDEMARSEAIYAEVAGKTFADRIREYAESDLASFMTSVALLLETDGHRCRSEGALAAGDALSSVGYTITKTWRTMGDKDVRDPHVRLEGKAVPLDEMFEIDGYRAPAPGLFGVAELDCNCRCELEINAL